MGNGVSSNTKNKTIRIKDPNLRDTGWNRSNSDGCLLDNLNTSKTKVDFLEQQINEYRDLLGVAEKNYNQAQGEADSLKKQLATVESSNLGLLDRVEMMEDELCELNRQVETNSSDHLSRRLIERDHEIDRLQAIVEKLTQDLKIVKCKSREKIKTLKTSLLEYKQENSLRVYQLNEQVKTLEGENGKLLTEKRRSSALSNHSKGTPQPEEEGDVDIDPRNHLIVELSSQVQQQEELIEELREKLRLEPSKAGSVEQEAQQKPPHRSFSAGEKRQKSRKNRAGSSKRASSGHGRVSLDKGGESTVDPMIRTEEQQTSGYADGVRLRGNGAEGVGTKSLMKIPVGLNSHERDSLLRTTTLASDILASNV